MDAIRYQEFDLVLESVADQYRVRVVQSPAGEAVATFVLPFTPLEQENFLLRMGRPRRGMRRLNQTELDVTRRFGQQLYDALFQGPVQETFVRSLDRAQGEGNRLRIRLRLHDVPQLAELPWEYLYDPRRGRFLAQSIETPIVRYLELSQQITPLTVQTPLNVLVIIAAPTDVATLDVEAEWHNIEAALATSIAQKQVTLTRLPRPTLGALQQLLRRQEFHILHFVGHGTFDAQAEVGGLLFEDDAGGASLATSLELATLLCDHSALRLVLLNACEGARTGLSDPFSGVAQYLVRQGIPAVIAMQAEISDDAAALLSREFYSAVADGYPVDAALTEARKTLFIQQFGLEWGTPVLYMRTPDGQIFDLSSTGTDKPTTATSLPSAVTTAAKLPSSRWFQAWPAVAALFVLVCLIWFALRWNQPSPPSATHFNANTSDNKSNGIIASADEPTLDAPATPTEALLATAQPAVLQLTADAPTTSNLLFRHTFEDTMTGWGDDSNGTWLVLDDGTGNHVYQGQAPANESIASDPPEAKTMAIATDYAITMRVRILRAGAADDDLFDTWLTFRDSVDTGDGSDGCDYYSLYFDTRLNQLLLAASATCDFVVLDVVPYKLEAGLWYDIRVAAQGSQISVAVNGESVIDLEDTTATRGSYYLNVSPTAIVQFDDIQVERLP